MTGPIVPDEISGYIDVKVPANARKRGLTPWRAWKKQWCVVRRRACACAPLEVQIGSGADIKMQIASGTTLCRTSSRSKQFAFGVFCEGLTDSRTTGGRRTGNGSPESRWHRPVLFFAGRSEFESQNWMRSFRDLLRPPHFDGEPCHRVSLIDTDYTITAGITGVYGNLKVTAQEVTICDSVTHDVRVTWDWKHLQQFHLAATGRPEDKGKICVIHTSRVFRGGAGNIYLFCDDAPKLLQSLLAASRLQRLLLSPLPSPPLPLRNARRLSRSENDLRNSCNSDECITPKNSSLAVHLRRTRLLSSQSENRSSIISEESGLSPKNRIASSLISASLGLMFSTPGCSEADSESMHEYQQVGFCSSHEDLVGDLIGMVKHRKPRRESGISVASGIYEEIQENIPEANIFPIDNTPVVYANSCHAPIPPPLPPRRRHLFQNLEHMNDLSFSGSSPQLSSPSHSEWDSRGDKIRFLWANEIAASKVLTNHEPDYMPMLPSIKSINSMTNIKSIPPQMEEEHYMVMSSIDTL